MHLSIISVRTKKEKKAVHNELHMHQTYPANPLYNLMNSMLFRPEGLIVQDDAKLQIKNLKTITVEHLKNGLIDFMVLEILFYLFLEISLKVL